MLLQYLQIVPLHHFTSFNLTYFLFWPTVSSHSHTNDLVSIDLSPKVPSLFTMNIMAATNEKRLYYCSLLFPFRGVFLRCNNLFGYSLHTKGKLKSIYIYLLWGSDLFGKIFELLVNFRVGCKVVSWWDGKPLHALWLWRAIHLLPWGHRYGVWSWREALLTVMEPAGQSFLRYHWCSNRVKFSEDTGTVYWEGLKPQKTVICYRWVPRQFGNKAVDWGRSWGKCRHESRLLKSCLLMTIETVWCFIWWILKREHLPWDWKFLYFLYLRLNLLTYMNSNRSISSLFLSLLQCFLFCLLFDLLPHGFQTVGKPRQNWNQQNFGWSQHCNLLWY